MDSGTLSFDATQYGAEYKIEYSYDDSTFYIDSVSVRLAQYVSVWWAFNLTVKINNTTISSGSENHLIDTFDWYDLGISGNADVTDTVKVTLTGSAIHNSYQFNVASPTSQTVTINSGGSDDDDDYSSVPYTLYVNQGEGTKLTVMRSWPDYRQCWDDLSSGEAVYYDGEDTFVFEAEALDGYTLDYYSFNGTQLGYKLENFVYFKKDKDWTYYQLASAAGASVTSTATPKEYKLSAIAGIGSYITVSRKSSKKTDAPLGVLSNGAKIYHFDVLEISVGTEAGYDIVDTIVSGCNENDDGSFTVIGNVNVTATTELNGLVYIDNGTSFVPCLIYIDNGVNWEQCIPYVDNGTSWIICS